MHLNSNKMKTINIIEQEFDWYMMLFQIIEEWNTIQTLPWNSKSQTPSPIHHRYLFIVTTYKNVLSSL